MNEFLPYAGLFIQAAAFVYYIGRSSKTLKSIEEWQEKHESLSKAESLNIGTLNEKCQTAQKWQEKHEILTEKNMSILAHVNNSMLEFEKWKIQHELSLNETIKRIHKRLDSINCMSRQECHDRALNYESKLQHTESQICKNINELKKDVNELNILLAKIAKN